MKKVGVYLSIALNALSNAILEAEKKEAFDVANDLFEAYKKAFWSRRDEMFSHHDDDTMVDFNVKIQDGIAELVSNIEQD